MADASYFKLPSLCKDVAELALATSTTFVFETAPFSAAGYIADMRAAGVGLNTWGGYLCLYTAECDEAAYIAVCWKWAAARRAEPEYVRLVIEALRAEKAQG